jgi:hypothetical protein
MLRLGTIIRWRNGAAARPSHVRIVAPLRAKPFPAGAPAWCNAPTPPFAPFAPSLRKYSRRPRDRTYRLDQSWFCPRSKPRTRHATSMARAPAHGKQIEFHDPSISLQAASARPHRSIGFRRAHPQRHRLLRSGYSADGHPSRAVRAKCFLTLTGTVRGKRPLPPRTQA